MDEILRRTGKYINQLSMFELLQEYTACQKEATEKALTCVSIPSDSLNRKPLEQAIIELADLKQTYATEIADRLTRK